MKDLGLSGNKISDISVLEKVNFPQLEGLGLSRNYIIDINCLEKINSPNLISISLSDNKINIESNKSLIEKLKSKIDFII